jgi:hypothetical protein
MQKKRGDNNRTSIIIALMGAAATIIAAILTGILSNSVKLKLPEIPITVERHDTTLKKDIPGPDKQQKNVLTVQADDPIFYKTLTGNCYHRGDCGFLKGSRIPVRLNEAKALMLKPCRRCKPPE